MTLYPTIHSGQQAAKPDAAQRRAARNPATDPEELRRLFALRQEANQSFKDDLASNPAMPPDLLKQLIFGAPSAFCRNPIAPLLLLETPDFLERIPELAIARMLRCPHAPAPLVQYIAESNPNPYLKKTARMHIQLRHQYPSASDEVDWVEEVHQMLWQGFRSPTEETLKLELVELAEFGALPATMAAMVEIPNPPGLEDFETLRERLPVGQAAALQRGFDYKRTKGRHIPSERQQHFFVGLSFNSEFDIAQKLRWSGNVHEIAMALARNPETPPMALSKLVRHRDVTTRRAAFHHPSCPPDALEAGKRFVFVGYLRTQPSIMMRTNPARRQFDIFRRFISLMYASEAARRPFLKRFALSSVWEDRITAAIALGNRPNGQPMKPKHRVLLEQLANDGIYLVRTVAQARLRGETFSMEEL